MDNDDKKQPEQTGDPRKLSAEDVEMLTKLSLEMAPGSPESVRAVLKMDAEKRKLELRLNERQVVALETIAGAASAFLFMMKALVEEASHDDKRGREGVFDMLLKKLDEEIAKRDAATAAK